ncbi:DNA recombination protein RmuC [Ottowia oryzae]|uniref:DNA recombination protein RmuC n=1 Tax=Ottowia oryzae TaxID=2109914 RepID=A0A2S0MHS7_9BURK|nr:DNA recombination protein RmuC [Ottowia oryzae]AVO35429.1 DNA recombination protein RmuC [Ottowia oryzae]
MTSNLPDWLIWLALAALLLNAVLLVLLLVRRPRRPEDVASRGEVQQLIGQAIGQSCERLERELRHEIGDSARGGRQELAQTLAGFQDAVTRQGAEALRTQNAQVDALATQLTQLRGTVAEQMSETRGTLATQLTETRGTLGDKLVEQLQSLGLGMAQQAAEATRTQNAQIDAFAQQLAQLRGGLSETLNLQLQALGESNARRMQEVRATLEQQLAALQTSNTAKLEEMRKTVDEKLHATLEQRLGESFKQVAERLELVHRGLGEMQRLAQDVGSLNRVLTNVKTRGVFGEVQLAGLLEQVFTPEQYAANVETVPGSNARVEFAIRLPGRREDGKPLWLPIDAKFPREDYERLLTAQEQADPVAAEQAAKAIEARLRLEARTIREKYIAAPHTTDFGILFVPTEGLYAEALRRPGLVEALQRDHRITLAGPTTLLATLSSLQMGFRTLALEKRSAEVWEVLGAVKTEFNKFGEFVAKVRGQAENVVKTLDQAQTRTNMMNRALKKVEALPDEQAGKLLPPEVGPAAEAGPGEDESLPAERRLL